jgi:purine-cytosine permease-like protein
MVLLQLAELAGYTIITAIISGQTLTAVSGGSLSLVVAIFVAMIGSLLVSFIGYRTLHYFEQYSWIPSLLAIIVSTGVVGRQLANQTETDPPTASAVVSFLALVASLALSWVGLVSDFAVYISPTAPRYVQVEKLLFDY